MQFDALLTGNLFLTVMIRDSNVKSQDRCGNNVVFFGGSRLDFITSQSEHSHVIKEPTHILENLKFCIDLLFTSELNTAIDFAAHTFLHSHYHPQIIYTQSWIQRYFIHHHLKESCSITRM